MFLIFRQNPLLFTGELIAALCFDDLTIARRVTEFSDCVKDHFTHDVAQFAVFASISRDQNELALRFYQWPCEIDVAVEHMLASVRIKEANPYFSIFASRTFSDQ